MEEYRDREYTERWVYELARLYKKAGRENKCVETCDDLILWFGEGKYVKKAMELKMNYAPLTAEQKSKYELWGEDKKKTAELKRKKVTAATVAGISAAAMESLQKASVIPSDGENREDSQIAGMEKAAAAKEQEPENEEIPEVPVQEPQIHVDTAQLQERLAKSFQEVLSGFNRTRVVNAFEALGRATGSETVSEPEEENIEEYHVTELEPEAVNETVISADQGVSGAHTTVEPDVIERKPEKSEKTEDKEVTSIQEMNLEELFAETSGALAEAAGGKAEEIREKEPEEELKIPEVAVAPEEELEIPEIAEVPEVSEPTEPEDETAEAAMAAFEASLGEEPEISFEEEPEEQDEVEELKASLSAGDTQELDLEAQLRAVMGDQEPIEEEAKEEPKEEQESSLAETLIPDLDLDLVLEVQKEKEDGIEEKVSELEMTESIEDIPEIQEVEEEAEASEPMILEEPEKPVEATVKLPQVETPEEKRMRILNDTRPEKLTEHQKNLFSYFAKVPGMDEQILDAIHGAFEYAGEKTSHRGNIAIMGSHGTGKTRLSEGLVKALCKEMGLEAAKYANLDASDMNRKDPAAIIGKMAGGFLLIERASFMTEETIQKLSQAMDFRTDSMILIIEDDKANMRKLLADYPEFAEKFATVISIPVFTNDELVTFARTYAKENGYRMDEMGVLALYTLIGDNQREDEPITIGKVKEMVDGAIRKASGIRLGRKISKRHTDEDGRIFLYEKDFDI